MLDEELSDERSDIRVIEKIIESLVEGTLGICRYRRIACAVCARRDRSVLCARIRQERLCTEVVVRRNQSHGIFVIYDPSLRVGASEVTERPAGEDFREFVYVFLRVCRNRVALLVQLPRPVLVQKVKPDAEELQYLTRIIFIRVQLSAASHVEIEAHGRTQRDVGHQLTI